MARVSADNHTITLGIEKNTLFPIEDNLSLFVSSTEVNLIDIRRTLIATNLMSAVTLKCDSI